jgi:hypothetical protein
MPKEKTTEKSLLETLADTIKAAAESIAHPTEGTPMEMPLNESGYALTHLQSTPKPVRKPTAKSNKTAKKPLRRAEAKKSISAAGRKPKKTAVKKVAKKAKAKKAKR